MQAQNKKMDRAPEQQQCSSKATASMPPSFPKRVTQGTALPGTLRHFSDCDQRESTNRTRGGRVLIKQ